MLALVVLSSLCACSDDAPTGDARTPASPSGTGLPSAAATSVPASVVAPECEDGPGRRVEQLPDVVVPALEVPPVTDESGEVVMEGFTVPAQLVDAGCVIRYDAAGGCLGAVEVTAATIPAATIPASTVGDQDFPAVVAPAVTRPAVAAPAVCQVERDGRLLTVTRAGVVREGFSRNGVARPGGSVGGVEVPTVRLEPIRLPDVDVDPGRLESRKLEGRRDVDVLTGEGRVSYVAPGRVLFETESAEIRPAAESALQAIVDRILEAGPAPRLLVDGHTDDRGSAAYGLALSRRRADAVASWLAGHGLRRAEITVRGLGERQPAVPNTSDAHRARNRRVVITVVDE
jgi:outer membrane protein OmpA-like peptidoglycan-associated protein